MTTLSRLLPAAVLAAVLSVPALADEKPKKPHVVFVTGDEEYRSEESMPFLAKILTEQHGFRCTICYALADDGTINPSRLDHIAGLDALKDADLMVVFTRFRALPDAQLKAILDYARSGKPMIGFRTATHAFQYKDGANKEWNDKFGRQAWGQKWITHHGHEKGEFLTDVKLVADQAKNPVLRGVTPFQVPSWLYHVQGGGDKIDGEITPLLEGTSLVSSHEKGKRTDRYPLTQPVAWTRTVAFDGGKPARVFFTTLGHPYDFKADSFRKCVVNGIYWSLGMEDKIPEGGCKADLPEGGFKLTNAGFGGHVKGTKPESK